MTTPVKDRVSSRSQITENSNPNLSTPKGKSAKASSPLPKSTKGKKSTQKNVSLLVSPRNKIPERKFIVAKKKPKAADSVKATSTTVTTTNVTCNCKENHGNSKKCPCIAYQNLRASQEDFFKNRGKGSKKDGERAENEKEECAQIEKNGERGDGNEEEEEEEDKIVEGESTEYESSGCFGGSTIKRRRAFLEEARKSIPETGKVKHLVEAFERYLTIKNSNDVKQGEEKPEQEKGRMKWALPLPGMQPPEKGGSLSSISQSDLFFTSDNFGMDSRVSSSFDSTRGGSCITTRSNSGGGGGRRSRRNSSESCGSFGGSKWKKKKQHRVTQLQPFKLRTEQRGKSKEEEFLKKLKEMCEEEEKLRIPVAQGLPWTTDEPECLVKPPVKDITRPIDLKLHSDVRAVERAEFDYHVHEKLSLIEQYKLERERQQKLAEEEEIRRLRKELVPKAQPMPYFDRPFIPQRSSKNPTIPKEPKFHIPEHKKIKCCMSWNEMIYTHPQ